MLTEVMRHYHLRRPPVDVGFFETDHCVFHTKLITDSTANWTLIPRQTGQRFQSKLDSHL